MKKIFTLLLSFSFILVLSSCSGKTTLKDGVHKGEYKDDKSLVNVTVTVKDGKIVDCTREERSLKDNHIKDENYGKDFGEESYSKAQLAVKNSKGYAKKLVEVQNIDKVDSVTGATISNKMFKEAVKNALKN